MLSDEAEHLIQGILVVTVVYADYNFVTVLIGTKALSEGLQDGLRLMKSKKALEREWYRTVHRPNVRRTMTSTNCPIAYE